MAKKQKKWRFINIVIITLLALLTVLIALLSGFAANEPPPAVTPYLQSAWPLLGIATLVLVVLTILQAVLQSAHDDIKPLSGNQYQQQSIEKRNRQRMLDRVHAIWIKGVLEQSLHGAALIPLDLSEQPDAIEDPREQLMPQQPDQSARRSPSGTRITQVYDGSDGQLLILGEPGSGKTTLLLELARDLLDRARRDDLLPIPVIFNLSSWNGKRQPLTDWMVEELHTKYQVPHPVAWEWVNNNQILPLLDGLDEVKSEQRAVCIEAVNDYQRGHGLVPPVVCCRSADYLPLSQTSRLRLWKAVAVQPLSRQQIDEYLASTGEQPDVLLKSIDNDLSVQELVANPFMLSIFSLAYQGMSVVELPLASTPVQVRHNAFERYVERMLTRRKAMPQKRQEQFRHWLRFLARTTFFSFSVKDLLSLMFPPEDLESPLYIWTSTVIFVLLGIPIVILLREQIVTLADILASWPFKPLNTIIPNLKTIFTIFFVIILNFGFYMFDWYYKRSGKESRLASVVTTPSVLGPIHRDAQPPKPLMAWMKVLRNALLQVSCIGFPIGAVFVEILLLTGSSPVGLYTMLGGGLFLGAYFGVVSEVVSTESAASWPPFFYSKIETTGLALLYGLPPGLSIILFAGLPPGLIFLLVFGLASLSSIMVAPFVRSFFSRVWLWRTNCLPWNVASFLDEAADRLLLRKTEENNYMFVHKLLRDYFEARLPNPPNLPSTQAAFRRFADHPTLPLALCELADHPTSPLPSLSSNDSRLLPCGHEKHRPDAHYCSVCGAPVPS